MHHQMSGTTAAQVNLHECDIAEQELKGLACVTTRYMAEAPLLHRIVS
jgi:hypothetical protein